MGSRSDHFGGRRFFNPTGMTGQSWTAVARMLVERRTPWPADVDVPPQHPPSLDAARAVVTFIGHATFLVQTAAGNLLTDPMYSERASPLSALGPRRVRQPAVRLDDLPPISVVLLSHDIRRLRRGAILRRHHRISSEAILLPLSRKMWSSVTGLPGKSPAIVPATTVAPSRSTTLSGITVW
jgi:hypothetical protein